MKNRDFRISDSSRKDMSYFDAVFETDHDIISMYRQAQEVSSKYNASHDKHVSAANIQASAVLHLIYQAVVSMFLSTCESNPFSRIAVLAMRNNTCMDVLDFYAKNFPTEIDHITAEEDIEGFTEETSRSFLVHQVFLANPAAVSALQKMINPDGVSFPEGTKAFESMMRGYFQTKDGVLPGADDLYSFLIKPARMFPDSLISQINYILERWSDFLPQNLQMLLLRAADFLREEQKPHTGVGPGPVNPPGLFNPDNKGEDYLKETESFTEDKSWMPNVVMIAKSTLVWLDQLSKKYKYSIDTLDKIPDGELDCLRDRGFTALWLIGLWERSPASRKIKNLCGNPDAESSAYSLTGYKISSRLGGYGALENLKKRCADRGIRLASDMVPNHTGIDSDWVKNNPELFVQQDCPPFPAYTYNGPDLSDSPEYDIRIEDHYYNRTDAAVTFQRKDNRTGKVTYIFHGNDGTSMPWNDTAQLDFLNPGTREAVIRQILDVARMFPIIRFDAAMTLAKRHIQRLWYPKPGTAGDIAGRASYAMSDEEFNRRIPQEFWREVVDRVSAELPDTLLLAEAFWMLEGYFVRTLGMHRVYNSAFMHMMKNEDNTRYIESIKNTLLFDPEILKRYVNFMNNPDEETAVAQFGSSDKYFGVCTLLATMPGLPMFGHGQIEGFHEKYGMEYQRAYWDETPDEGLIKGHEAKIFPLLKMRRLFSGCSAFQLFEVYAGDGSIIDSVYAYVNGDGNHLALVLYNNRYEHAEGTICTSVPKLVKNVQSRYTETVSIGSALRLTHSFRRYCIFREFETGLWYIVPSIKFYDEGFKVSLGGYQTRILLDIREAEDTDGSIEKLCNSLNGRGIQDIESELRFLSLQPIFNAAEPLTNEKFIGEIKKILEGHSTHSCRVSAMQALASCYTYLEELREKTDAMGLDFHRIVPRQLLDEFCSMDRVCSMKMFSDAAKILRSEMSTIVAASFLLYPYVKRNNSLEKAVRTADFLMLDRLFGIPRERILRCVLILCSPGRSISDLLQDNTFRFLIGSNKYQGVMWYNGEAFQECMFYALYSNAVFCSDVHDEKYYAKELEKWLGKNTAAKYHLDKLIE